jgi:hypothetical protein
MSEIKVANISHPSATSPAIKLAADGTAGIAALNVNTQSGTTYTFTGDDAGRLVAASNASAKTFTIPPQSSVAWAAGTVLNVVNYGAGALTVNGGSGVTVTNTAKTLAQYESAALIRTGSDAWTLVPFSGGVGDAKVSATTGSPTVTTSGSTTIYEFTGNGSITFDNGSPGLAEILVCGGGGGTAADPGGGGGVEFGWQKIAAGTYSITVGAGGVGGGQNGGSSAFGSIYSVGGGTGSAVSHINRGGGGGQRGQSTNSGAGGARGNGSTGARGAGVTWYGYEYGRGGAPTPNANGVNYGEGGNGNQSGTAGRQGVVVVRVG